MAAGIFIFAVGPTQSSLVTRLSNYGARGALIHATSNTSYHCFECRKRPRQRIVAISDINYAEIIPSSGVQLSRNRLAEKGPEEGGLGGGGWGWGGTHTAFLNIHVRWRFSWNVILLSAATFRFVYSLLSISSATLYHCARLMTKPASATTGHATQVQTGETGSCLHEMAAQCRLTPQTLLY